MRRSVVALACVGLVVLAGCNGDESPPGPPTFDGDEQTETSAPATSDVEPTTATAAPPTDTETATATATATEGPTSEEPTETDEPGDPEDFEDTEAGAEAFVRYYTDLWNEAAQAPSTSELDQFHGEDCSRCSVLQGLVDQLVMNDERSDGPVIAIESVRPLDVGYGYIVEVDGVDGPYSYVDSGDEVTRGPFDAEAVKMIFELSYAEPEGFVVDEIVHLAP